jgi:zinc protease
MKSLLKRKLKNIVIIGSLLSATSVLAGNYIDDNVKKLNWNGIDVVWLEDNSLPTYDVSIYFNQGALGDKKNLEGTAEIMFSQLTAGTNRFTQKEIIESLEFYGASYGSSVTHEFADFTVSGLVKDYIPTMKMVCHLFNDAYFPKSELKLLKQRVLSSMKSVVTKHGALASHIFRNESLKGTGYEVPVGGTMKSLKKIKVSHLKNRLNEFNNKVYKRIYIKGPKSILGIESIIKNDCHWNKAQDKVSYPFVKAPVNNKEIIFVSVPKANQVQVRLGRVLTTEEVTNNSRHIKSFAAKFMGGGFTSRLVQGLRVEKGLTYSAGAYASEQKNYGRSGISTFTKNETIVELLNTIKQIVKDASTSIKDANFERSKRNIKGNYLLGLESTSEFLKNLMYYDHKGLPYSDIYKFSGTIDDVTNKNLADTIGNIFTWDKQTIVVLGDASIAKVLVKNGFKLKKVRYKSYL